MKKENGNENISYPFFFCGTNRKMKKRKSGKNFE